MFDRRAGGEPRTLVAADAAGRGAAFAIDTVVLSMLAMVALALLAVAHGPVVELRRSGDIVDRMTVDRLWFAVDTAALCGMSALYFVGSWIRWGATLGQRCLGIEVRPSAPGREAARLGMRTGLVRWLALGVPLWVAAAIVSGNVRWVLWAAGVLWYVALGVSVARGGSIGGFHDRLAGTTAVRWAEPVVADLDGARSVVSDGGRPGWPVRSAVLAVAAALVVVVVAAVIAAGGDDAPDGTIIDDAVLLQGGEVYELNCAGCHGAGGEGASGPVLADARVAEAYPDLADRITLIERGRREMPAFEERLTDQEIEAVAHYIASL